MITTTIERKTTTDTVWTDITSNVNVTFTLKKHHNKELDTGSFDLTVYETQGQDGLFPPFSMYRVTQTDGTNTEVDYFVGIDSRTQLRTAWANTGTVQDCPIYQHGVSLIEPSKLLQGVLIDGFKVTQPEDTADRLSLLAVLQRLLAVTPLTLSSGALTYTVTGDTDVIAVLAETISPQFEWNTQTTLWECLCDIGAVIDCIPRLTISADGNTFSVITFDFVDNSDTVYPDIVDEFTNVVGESVDEQQFNTQLGAVVENIIEQ